MVFALLKWILVLGLLACGTFFLATGLGVEVSLIEYKGLKAYGVPVGCALIAAGVLLAALWKIEMSTKQTTIAGNGFAAFTSIVESRTKFLKK